MRPRQSPDNPMGFEFPYEDIKLPEWANDAIEAWHYAVEEGGNHFRASFNWIENMMLSHVYAYIPEGMELGATRYKKGYEEKGATSFKDYCDRFYPKSHQYALNTILASQVGWELLLAGFQEVPTNVSQALALSKTILTDEFGQPDIIGSWKHIVQWSKAAGKKITVKLINFLVNPGEKEEIVKVPIPKSKWKKFEQKAKELGFNPNTALQNLIEDFTEEDEENLSPDSEEPEPQDIIKNFNDVEQHREEIWNKDVDSLYQAHLNTRTNYDTT